jgi:hypothetical protein
MIGQSSGVPEETEASKQKMLEGYRRAHQWLRLNELGDETGIAALRANFDDPVDYMWIRAALASNIEKLLSVLGDEVPRGLRDGIDGFKALTETHDPGSLPWQSLAEVALMLADDLAKRRWPRQEDRLGIYESAARTGYEIAEPGHPGRKGVFDE